MVAILGARQTGKSTLARSFLPDFQFLDLEDPIDFKRMKEDPILVLKQSKKIVLDEAQRIPELFSLLRNFIDQNPTHKIVVLGSASPTLTKQISESLTGRIGLLELGLVSIFEEAIDPLWIKGSFPRIHWGKPKPTPEEWYASYLKTFLQQDIPQLGFRISYNKLFNLLTMIAHSQGSICNLNELGGSLGLNYHTVAHIIDIFEGTYIVRRLSPFYANIRKRLVKSPKLYIRDTGLLHQLLGIEFRKKDLLRHPKAGASFETFCVEQISQHMMLAFGTAKVNFYRTHTGSEVDLLLERNGKLIPIEIKLSPHYADLTSLQIVMKQFDIKKGYLLTYSGEELEINRNIQSLGLAQLLKKLKFSPSERLI
jgi:predicted AAA+ superfamily ATPase